MAAFRLQGFGIKDPGELTVSNKSSEQMPSHDSWDCSCSISVRRVALWNRSSLEPKPMVRDCQTHLQFIEQR